MRRFAALVIAFSGLTGCALVSGLSDLDIGSDASFDAATDVSIDASKDVAPLDVVVILDAANDGDASAILDATKDADAAPACAVAGSDPAIVQTSCATGNPIYGAGTIPTGTYSLTQVREFPQTCTGYVSVNATGLLLVSVQGSTYNLQERLTINGVTTNRYYTAIVSGTTMSVALTCGPAIPSSQWGINVSAQGGKTQFAVYKTSPPTDQRFFWLQQ